MTIGRVLLVYGVLVLLAAVGLTITVVRRHARDLRPTSKDWQDQQAYDKDGDRA
jgi:hypothetical protein